MNQIIDFHAHAFPDRVAAKAIPYLEEEGDVKAHLDGTVSDLLRSMDRAGIGRSVICSIATRVEQFQPILDWSAQIRSERLIPLPSVHPDDPELVRRIEIIAEQGFVGIKLHPYYQDFFLAESRMDRLYDALAAHGLLLVVHTGYDIAFPRIRRADPEQIVTVAEKFPKLRLIATHLGAWEQWDEVESLLAGRPIYMELSFSMEFLSRERFRRIVDKHPDEYLLFGTDSPWADQEAGLELLRGQGLDQSVYERIVGRNAAELLSL